MKHDKEFPRARPYHDRHGKRRWRYRHKGFTAELGTDYGSSDFVRRYEAAVAGRSAKGVIGASRTRHKSLNALVASFYVGTLYRNLNNTTKATYRGIIERFREQHSDKLVPHIRRRHILKVMADKSETPAAANNLLRMLRLLLAHAVDLEWIESNPAIGIKRYRVPGDGFHTWNEGEIQRYFELHEPGTLAHTAMSLMLYTGAARSDAVRLGWGNLKSERLRYRRQKTAHVSEVAVDIPIHPGLAAILDDLPEDAFTFLQTNSGKSRSPNGLGNLMRKWCDTAGLPDCTSHGLRKACARRLAEAGATPHEIQAVTGHKTLKEVERYTRDAERSNLADSGFDKLSQWSDREQTLTNHPARFVKKKDK